MTTTAVIVHQLPGRLRLRFSEGRGDAEYFSALSDIIAHINGVDQVKTNASTGSVVIEFSDTAENLTQRLQQQGVSIANPSKTDHADVQQYKPDRHNTVPFHLVSNRDINPMFMLGALLTAVGVVQTFRGKVLVPSISVLWYAIEAFRQSGKSNSLTKDMEGH
jgi:DNA/RNA endonuclease YhcR with UshA esterase domain